MKIINKVSGFFICKGALISERYKNRNKKDR